MSDQMETKRGAKTKCPILKHMVINAARNPFIKFHNRWDISRETPRDIDLESIGILDNWSILIVSPKPKLPFQP